MIMKELSIEEKAKRYDKSFERAKQQLEGAKVFDYDNEQIAHDIRTTVCSIFPELKESEDERIRKELIDFVKSRLAWFPDCKRFTAWLEKEGEQREQLINKACDLLVNCIEDFMLRRMEIWDEECKKQTLENIRKKLEE